MACSSNFAISCESRVRLLQAKFDFDLSIQSMLLDLFETAFVQFLTVESFPW